MGFTNLFITKAVTRRENRVLPAGTEFFQKQFFPFTTAAKFERRLDGLRLDFLLAVKMDTVKMVGILVHKVAGGTSVVT